MYRGTTPTFIFTLHKNVDVSLITELNISFATEDEILIEKELSDCTLEDNKITFALTEQETLEFENADTFVYVQIRAKVGEKVFASNIAKIYVKRILKDGILGGTI